ncbi:hypothetical protein [Thermostichus vulcanus]|uniref:Uncharacterized protein n=1 Tax=Thermostichus vulcanus str. 'Rupite' TaxID=2813851 RepID=A0ABT0CCH2_THEVL|nr:hypothetical protein [Thermostichus vulcanus]MCJ2543402.1 hypothetical protein [Thermostichus vulcanus str. 'Rupite']
MKAILAAALVGMSGIPFMAPVPVVAQQLFELGAYRLQQGTVIPVGSLNSETPEYFYPDTVYPLEVAVTQSIYDSQGRLVIPAGSRIHGQMEPAPGGSRFVGTSIVIGGRTYSLRASSNIIHDEKDPRQYSGEAIVADAAIGAAAGAVLGALTGGVSVGNVLGGAVAGVVVGNVTAPQVVVLRPGQSFNLTLEAPLNL